jgi:alkyldihydroxyacetonephosphate synthase
MGPQDDLDAAAGAGDPGRSFEQLARPSSLEELDELVRRCHRDRIPLVPLGGGSGRMGAAVPLRGGLGLDLGALDWLLVDGAAGEVECGPGLKGLPCLKELASQGLTLGHYPGSVGVSTVGGWVSTGSMGSASSRYGGIRQMIRGLELHTPGAGILRTGTLSPVPGPDHLSPVICGSEGTLGVLARVCLKTHPLPERRVVLGFTFPSLADGLGALQELALWPEPLAFLQLLDPVGTMLEEALRTLPRRVLGMSRLVPDLLLALPLSGLARGSNLRASVLLLAGDEGPGGSLEERLDGLRFVAERHRGKERGPFHESNPAREPVFVPDDPFHRFHGLLNLEEADASVSWDRVLDLHGRFRRALPSGLLGRTVFTHAGPGGCSLIMGFASLTQVPGRERASRDFWKAWSSALVGPGVAVNHFLGVGIMKQQALERQNNGAQPVLAALQAHLDPHGIMNPGRGGRS